MHILGQPNTILAQVVDHTEGMVDDVETFLAEMPRLTAEQQGQVCAVVARTRGCSARVGGQS